MKADELDAQFKTLIFANNPSLYHELFVDKEKEKAEREVEWLRPNDPEDLKEIFETLKELEANS